MKFITLSFMSLLLASCGYQKPIIILPTDEAITECSVGSPPEITGKDSQDKLILTSAWILQTNNLAACNKKLKMLQTWKRVNQERFGENK